MLPLYFHIVFILLKELTEPQQARFLRRRI